MPETETTILLAAKAVFLRKGLEAASMQDIAAEAGISRTLLHYYYRTKETLFRAILVRAVGEIVPRVASIIETDLPLLVKIERVVDSYLDLLLDDPLLPHFLVIEIRRDPQVLVELIRSRSGNFGALHRVQQQIAGELRIPVPAGHALAHLFTSVYGLLLFPFLAKPALDEVFFDNDPAAFVRFMRERKPIILAMLAGLLKTPPPPPPAARPAPKAKPKNAPRRAPAARG
ncbi:MAG: TetR/AcrR family transcriptional regulator [Opitutaceae bacterium]|jgi:AcrR family transcriptional regulator|nr:TetR/AcrR family transcriptional regulator [Opitutaceae bacterium]